VSQATDPTPSIVLRHDLRPGDLGTVINLHGTAYAAEYGFDVTFEAYVAGPLAEFALTRTDRDCLWVAERAGQIVGCVAIVGTSAEEAQLRWFLVAPEARGLGLGKRLLHEAVMFCRNRGYQSVFLWTVSALTAAAGLYRSVGFQRAEATPAQRWGVPVVEEKYVLRLGTVHQPVSEP
jgi:GNAT superfamily N-acetyltransferase